MNTNPDEIRLARWLDDELDQSERAAFEAGLGEDAAAQLAAREEVRRWKAQLAAVIAASEEPPYPEFFNHRIGAAIRATSERPVQRVTERWWWQRVLLPVAACAGMAFTFWLGTRTHSGPAEVSVVGAPRAIPVEPFVYTPESGVRVERFASSDASATVIVLNGVAAIPDAEDFSLQSKREESRQTDSTAAVAPPTFDPSGS